MIEFFIDSQKIKGAWIQSFDSFGVCSLLSIAIKTNTNFIPGGYKPDN